MCIFFSVDPKDPSIEYEWFDVGMLTYNPETELFLVQKTDLNGRILDAAGKVVLNGGTNGKGKFRPVETCAAWHLSPHQNLPFLKTRNLHWGH